jgi:hypothetical protein
LPQGTLGDHTLGEVVLGAHTSIVTVTATPLEATNTGDNSVEDFADITTINADTLTSTEFTLTDDTAEITQLELKPFYRFGAVNELLNLI